MKPLLSIIIPCYNTATTLDDTLESVSQQNYDNWEAILVNDGSPDNLEVVAKKWVEKDKRFKYFKKENGGLGSARNFGISKAKGDYILPLDSDNKIRPDYAQQAIALMEANPNIGVVYGDAMYFGEQTGRWDVGAFDRFKLLKTNYIDACAVIRKRLFDELGGYDEKMPHQGQEDWEFWLRILHTNFEFYHLNKVSFDYRVMGTSMIRTLASENRIENDNYTRNKHAELYIEAYMNLYGKYAKLKSEQSLPFYKKILMEFKKLFSK